MKKVMIAIDYDPTAQKVAETGYTLAKAMNAEVTLLHVVADPTYYSTLEFSPIMGFTGFGSADDFKFINDKELIEAGYKFLTQIKKHLKDDGIKDLVKEGDFADTIIKTAKETNADIIVMGTHSRRWLESILVGSVAEKVLHHSEIPMFIVPTKEKK